MRGSSLFPICVLLAVSGMAAPSTVGAQDASPAPLRVWMGLGLAGGASRNVDGGFGLMGEVVVQRAPHQWMLRALGLADFSNFPDGGSDGGFGEVGVLYGRVATGPYGQASVSAGLSVVLLEGCRGSPSDDCQTVGVPLVAGASFDWRVVGLGVEAYGNLNPISPYAGIVLAVHLGWMP